MSNHLLIRKQEEETCSDSDSILYNITILCFRVTLSDASEATDAESQRLSRPEDGSLVDGALPSHNKWQTSPCICGAIEQECLIEYLDTNDSLLGIFCQRCKLEWLTKEFIVGGMSIVGRYLDKFLGLLFNAWR